MLHSIIEGAGPAIVLLHPVGLDAASWRDVASRLAADHKVISVDLRGHGSSPPVSPAMSLRDYAADVAELIGQLKLDRVAVVGLSFGGMIAQTLAIEFPELLRGVVIAGCPCDLNDAQRDALRKRGTKALQEGMETIVEETISRWFTPAFIADGGAKAVEWRLLADDPASWASAWAAIGDLRTGPRLGEVAIPALCVAGAQDAASPVAALQEIVEKMPNARLAVIPRAPHMMQIETPAMFVTEICNLLNSLPSE
jgi:pimeloyl-ACP methyl ester carboxylesterase